MQNPTIAFIGGGNMAASLVGGLIADGWNAERIHVAEPNDAQRERVRSRYAVQTGNDNHAAIADAEVIVLAVKPQSIKAVAEQLAADLARRPSLILSIAAGVREPDLRRWLGGDAAVVRTMPNTPALVQSGATVLFANARVSAVQRDMAESVMRAVGLTLWVEDETLMDAVTALSGSGPAYFFLLMEALEEAGRHLGLAPQQARLLTLQTALGAAKMAIESSDGPAELRQRVTSPGGTTERALAVLEQGDLRGLIQTALDAAHTRSAELATMLGDK